MARRTAQLGTTVVIADGADPDILNRIVTGQAVGTRFPATKEASPAKRWLASADERAALPPEAIREFQKNAPEHVHLDITKVVQKRTKKKGTHYFSLQVEAHAVEDCQEPGRIPKLPVKHQVNKEMGIVLIDRPGQEVVSLVLVDG